jgi:hypothetical protein
MLLSQAQVELGIVLNLWTLLFCKKNVFDEVRMRCATSLSSNQFLTTDTPRRAAMLTFPQLTK